MWAEGRGHDEVGGEEGELDHHRLRVVEVEDHLQVGNDDVIQAGDEPPHEKQGGENCQGSEIAPGLPFAGATSRDAEGRVWSGHVNSFCTECQEIGERGYPLGPARNCA